MDETISFPLWLDTNPQFIISIIVASQTSKPFAPGLMWMKQRLKAYRCSSTLASVRQVSPSHVISDIAHPLPIEVRKYG